MMPLTPATQAVRGDSSSNRAESDFLPPEGDLTGKWVAETSITNEVFSRFNEG
jgi:hypothetical protein